MAERQETMTIQMTTAMSGGRIDDRPWPPPFTDFEVVYWEGQNLVRAGVAFEATDRTPPSQQPGFGQGASDPEPEGQQPQEPVVLETGPVTVVDHEPGPGEAQVVEEPAHPGPERPQPADPKQAWVDYAIAQGIPPDMANAWTKQRLMAEFGGRL
jgi:hypothetical protein